MSNKPITQVLGDGLTYQVSGRGRLCCEEAALTANEVERLTRERDEARGSRDYWIDLYGELRDELQAKLVEAQSALDGTGLASGLDAAEDERIEEQAKALHGELYPFGPSWENTGDYAQRCYITAIRAGWTPPTNPV